MNGHIYGIDDNKTNEAIFKLSNDMEKLTLEHLAAYLPHDVQVYGSSDLWTLKGIIASFKHNDETLEIFVNVENGAFKNSNASMLEHSLILHPLSDLSKLGDDNILITEHTINMLIGDGKTYGEIEFSHYQGDLEFIIEGDSTQGYDSSKTINYKIFETVRTELLKGHYDIFNLIPQNLAIDINTLPTQS